MEGIIFNRANISSPVINDMSIRINMDLALMSSWAEKILYVKGAFLRGEFEEEEETCYVEVPQGFEKC